MQPFKYFRPPLTADTVKKQFVELSKKLHPDKGGNADEFKQMYAEYEHVCNLIVRAKGRKKIVAQKPQQSKKQFTLTDKEKELLTDLRDFASDFIRKKLNDYIS